VAVEATHLPQDASTAPVGCLPADTAVRATKAHQNESWTKCEASGGSKRDRQTLRNRPWSRPANSRQHQHARTIASVVQDNQPAGFVPPFSHRFATCLGTVLASGGHEKAPRGLPEGRWRRKWTRYLAVTSDSARWKNRARPTIRRTIFAACVSESLNADFNSPAISSLPFPDRNK
jgi:hypothetical protein